MNKEKQLIAIAEACGLPKPYSRWSGADGDTLCHSVTVEDGLKRAKTFPDYLNDLNAMHEAWFNVIFPKPSLCLEYYQNLCMVVETKKDGAHIFGVCLYDKVTNATAAQRAEAFLRTIGKWV